MRRVLADFSGIAGSQGRTASQLFHSVNDVPHYTGAILVLGLVAHDIPDRPPIGGAQGDRLISRWVANELVICANIIMWRPSS
jgi:hypothetical protein